VVGSAHEECYFSPTTGAVVLNNNCYNSTSTHIVYSKGTVTKDRTGFNGFSANISGPAKFAVCDSASYCTSQSAGTDETRWDLHLNPADTICKDAGIAAASDDVDKQVRARPSATDIGADEIGSDALGVGGGPTATVTLEVTPGTAAPSRNGVYLLKARSYNVSLTTSVLVVGVPTQLTFTDSGGHVVQIPLTGSVPGNVFTGSLSVGTGTSEGTGTFSLAAGALDDGQGHTGGLISSNQTVTVDRTAPVPPQGVKTSQ
jgi:hypothetical protein